MKLHQAVARTLHDGGVRTVFGLMGDANMLYLIDFQRDHGGRFVGAVHEGGAVAMAAGFALATGRLGVASVTHGPAVTNTLTALTEAVRGHTPLLLLTGDTPAGSQHLQHIDLRSLAVAVGAKYERVHQADSVTADLAHAMWQATTHRQPVLLDIPAVLLTTSVDYQPVRRNASPSMRITPDPVAVDQALGAVVSARRPIVLAGRGAVWSGARDELVRLARLIGAPVATTLLAKDLFHGEPFDLGICGTLSTEPASWAIGTADCVIAFGASLNDFTAGGGLLDGKRIVHCDVNAASLGRYRPVDVAVLGDAKLVAETMSTELAAADVTPGSFCNEELRTRLAAHSPSDEFTGRDGGEHDAGGVVDMRAAILQLDAILPANRTIVTDAGHFLSVPWRYLHIPQPGQLLSTANFGSIGLGLATAIGAAVGQPERTTVLVTGDGGFMMSTAEFSTAVRLGLPLLVIVLNDGGYGAEYHKLRISGVDPSYALMEWPDLVSLAGAFGGRGSTVRCLADLKRIPCLLDEGSSPVLVDVKLDPAVRIGYDD